MDNEKERIDYKTIMFRLRMDDSQDFDLYNWLMNCRTTTARNNLIKNILYSHFSKTQNDITIGSSETATSMMNTMNTNTDMSVVFKEMINTCMKPVLDKFSDLENQITKIKQEKETEPTHDNQLAVLQEQPVTKEQSVAKPVVSETQTEIDIDSWVVPPEAMAFVRGMQNK